MFFSILYFDVPDMVFTVEVIISVYYEIFLHFINILQFERTNYSGRLILSNIVYTSVSLHFYYGDTSLKYFILCDTSLKKRVIFNFT